MVYLLHFTRPYDRVQHYIGFCEEGNLVNRLHEHRTGQGARLMAVIKEHGIGFVLARTWCGADRNEERRLKNVGHSKLYCPICQGKLEVSGWDISGHYWSVGGK